MAYITDKNTVYSMMKSEQAPFFKVVDNDKRIMAINDDNSDMDTAISYLDNLLSSVNGQVIISLSKKPFKDKAGGGDQRNITVALMLGNPSMKNSTSAPVGTIGGTDLLGLLITQMNNSHQMQLDNMNKLFEAREREEKLKREISNPDNEAQFTFLNQALKRVDKLFDLVEKSTSKSKPIAINGIGNAQKEPVHLTKIEMTEEEQKKLNLSIHVLLTNDPEFVANLETLAKLVTDDPDMYKMAIKKLKAFS